MFLSSPHVHLRVFRLSAPGRNYSYSTMGFWRAEVSPLISLHSQIAHHYNLQYFSWTVSFHHWLIFQRHFFLCLLRQENWQLAAGLLSCANQLYLPVLPGCDMAGAKDNGQEETAQPQSCSDSLQLSHGWPVSVYVLWGTACASQPPLKFENVYFSIFIC